MSFEDKKLGNIDRRRRRHEQTPPLIEKSYRRAKNEVLNNPDYSIQATQFADLYGEENVLADMKKMKDLEEKFKIDSNPRSVDARKHAETFEAIMLMHTELSEWLGDARVLKTSRYDDYINKVDMIAEWQRDSGTRQLALAVDVTFGSSVIGQKMENIRDEIEKDKLGVIKYFQSEFDNYRGEKSNVPRVIVGASRQNVQELAALWMQNDNKALGAHPVQRAVLEEIHLQLSSMKEYAQRRNKPNATRAYEHALHVVNDIFSQKQNLALGMMEVDPVFERIREKTQGIFS